LARRTRQGPPQRDRTARRRDGTHQRRQLTPSRRAHRRGRGLKEIPMKVTVEASELAALLGGAQEAKCAAPRTLAALPPSRKRIVVLDGRWNLIGQVRTIGDEVVITDASVIRYWGTTAGLGEIAKSGPTA